MDTQIKLKILLCLFLVLASINLVFAESFKAGTSVPYYPTNPLTNGEAFAATIIPSLMIIIAIVFVLMDFGAIGVCIGGIISMMFLNVLGLIGLSVMSIISYFVLGGLLIFKMAQ